MISTSASERTESTRYFVDEAGVRWRSDVQALTYRVGPVHLGVARLRSCSLMTSFLNLPAQIDPPMAKLSARQYDAIVYPALPAQHDRSRLEFRRSCIKYVPRHEDRYFIRMEGTSYEAYMGGFSGKTRNTLKRHARRFADANGGQLNWRVYTTADEMSTFRDLALSISKRTYQHAEGVGLSDTEEFTKEMAIEAAAGRARGYILFFQDKPAAFAYCTIDGSVLLYAVVGYDPDLSDRSPGRILLLEMIKALFEEGVIKYFDFGMEEYDYKSFFGTDHIRCARVFFFPWSLENILIVLSHMVVLDLWRIGSLCLSLIRGLGARLVAVHKLQGNAPKSSLS